MHEHTVEQQPAGGSKMAYSAQFKIITDDPQLNY
jgi:hypothetical protein